MDRSYWFRGPFGRIHVVPRGAPAPERGVRTHFLRLEFELGAGTDSWNERERARMLRDLGFPEIRPATLDVGERFRLMDRWREEVERVFEPDREGSKNTVIWTLGRRRAPA